MADCPRCKLEMQAEMYEERETLFCATCWGHWLTRDVFTEILKSERYAFDDEESESILRGWAAVPESVHDLDAVVACPMCQKPTERKAFSDDCLVMLDLCHEHGIWLDASEIKQVQVYFDTLK